jgi:hypothetical protein
LKLKLITALAALPLAAAAHAGNLYSACEYEDGNTGKRPFTQLFTLSDDHLDDGYGGSYFEKTVAWEKDNPVDKYTTTRPIGSYRQERFVGQFKKFVESKDSHARCWATTDKERALTWYRRMLADGRYDKFTIQDWRPTKDAFVSVEQWPPN